MGAESNEGGVVPRRLWPFLGLALVAVVLFRTCGTADTGPIAVLAGKYSGGDHALFEGTLRLEDGCLLIDSGQSQLLVAVQSGSSSWNEGRQEMRYRGCRYRVGEMISVGGGGGTPASQLEWEVPPAENCMDYQVWVMNSP
jgi:hypothetical protein